MCAMMQKLRMRFGSVAPGSYSGPLIVGTFPWSHAGPLWPLVPGPGILARRTQNPRNGRGPRVANIKSQIKRNKQNEKRRLRNKAVKSSLKTAIRKFNEATRAGDTTA